MPYNLFISHSWTYGDSYDRLIEMLDDAPNFYYKDYSVPKNDPIHNASYEVTDGKVRFPWFHIFGSSEEVTAYTQLITALVEMAKNSKRITAKERTVENEKYAFRCFLLRLGFIGDEYKASRKILLKNLDGNSAFRDKM